MSKTNTATATKQDTDAPEAPPTWLVFAGKTGKDADFEQWGEHVLFSLDGQPLVLTPGLQRIDAAEWARWEKIPAVAELVTSEQLTVVDEQLTGFAGRGRLRALAVATVSAEGVEHIQELELAKPSTGKPGERRDAELLELLTKRLEAARARRTLSVADIMAQAKSTGQMHEARKR